MSVSVTVTVTEATSNSLYLPSVLAVACCISAVRAWAFIALSSTPVIHTGWSFAQFSAVKVSDDGLARAMPAAPSSTDTETVTFAAGLLFSDTP